MLYNLVNIGLGDNPDIVSFVLSDLLTFLQVFKTNYTLPVEGHVLNSLYLWQIYSRSEFLRYHFPMQF